MNDDKRKLLADVFAGKSVDRVPVGFWFHFVHPETQDAIKNPSVRKANIDGQRDFFKTLKPDFVKLMSDGYFCYPHPELFSAKDISVLKKLTSIGPDNPWIVEQGTLVSEQRACFDYDVYTFYTIFSPATMLKFMLGNFTLSGNKKLSDFIMQDKEAVKHALDVMAEDFIAVSEQAIKAGGADGIFLSVQNIQDCRVNKAVYDEVIAPSEIKILEAVNKISEQSILHICGYEGVKNHIEWYKDYPVKIVNWATVADKVSLKKGRKIFGDRIILGGFANGKNSVLYRGTEGEIKDETKRILKECGTEGVILGADCTIPYEIDLRHLDWVREAAKKQNLK